MSQLVFQPALDPYHAVFRAARLLPILKQHPVSRDHVRILDFYLLFPFLITSIRLLREHQHFKRLSRKYASTKPYGHQPEGALLFARMEPMQNAALDTLAANGLLDMEALASDKVVPAEKLLPKPVGDRAAALNSEQEDLIAFLSALAREYTILGENGLKARTGLKEHRYDAV